MNKHRRNLKIGKNKHAVAFKKIGLKTIVAESRIRGNRDLTNKYNFSFGL
jgi:hypothetical protein